VTADPTDADVLDVARCAAQQINERSNSLYQQLLYSVVQAEEQQTGVRYRLTIDLVPTTDCRNDGAVRELSDCTFDPAAAVRYVVIVETVLDAPCRLVSFVMADTKATGADASSFASSTASTDGDAVTTSSQSTAPPMVGGWTPLDVDGIDHELAMRMGACLTSQINGDRQKAPQAHISSIISGRKQVVAGLKVELTAELQWWRCESDMIIRIPDALTTYTATIFYQPWQPADQQCVSVVYDIASGAEPPEPTGCTGLPDTGSKAGSSGGSSSGSSNSLGAAEGGGLALAAVVLVALLILALIVVVRRRQAHHVRLAAGDTVASHHNPLYAKSVGKAMLAGEMDADAPPYEPTSPVSPGTLGHVEAPPSYADGGARVGRVLSNPTYDTAHGSQSQA
jgi:hypothetical protein